MNICKHDHEESTCKKCKQTLASKKWREKNIDVARERARLSKAKKSEYYNEHNRKYYHENKEKIAESKKRYRKENITEIKQKEKRRYKTNCIDYILRNIKKKCIDKNIPYTITKEDIIIPEKCPILGIDIIVGSESLWENSPSIDRLVPELGYTKENVRIISRRANTIKNCGTAAEHRMIADWMDKELQKIIST